MHICVVTLFPPMLEAVTGYGVTGRAVTQRRLTIATVNPRDFAQDRHRTVDDRPYGGGPGMLMKVAPLQQAIAAARRRTAAASGAAARVIYLSPQGRRLDHGVVRELADCGALVLVAGRYEGVDERLLETTVDDELSIGDYVLSGGELPAMVVIDAVARLLPGTLGHAASAREDSFADGLLDCPQYTRPEVYAGRAVPEVLRSGDHERVRRWRLQQALGRTRERRPELLAQRALSPEERELLAAYCREHGIDE